MQIEKPGQELTPIEREVLRSLRSIPQRERQKSTLRTRLHRSILRLQRELDSLSQMDEVE